MKKKYHVYFEQVKHAHFEVEASSQEEATKKGADLWKERFGKPHFVELISMGSLRWDQVDDPDDPRLTERVYREDEDRPFFREVCGDSDLAKESRRLNAEVLKHNARAKILRGEK